MDPSLGAVGLAAAALLARKVGEGVASEAGKTAWFGVKHLHDRVLQKIRSDERAALALNRAQDHPHDENRLKALAEILLDFAKRDSALQEALYTLVQEAEREPSGNHIVTQIFGNARVGTVATFRDVHGDVTL